jgi:hypothetical protein
MPFGGGVGKYEIYLLILTNSINNPIAKKKSLFGKRNLCFKRPICQLYA